MLALHKHILNGNTCYIMTAFHSKDPDNDELTQHEQRVIAQIAKRLKKTAVMFYHEGPRCKAIMETMLQIAPEVKWNGFLEIQDDDLLSRTEPLWNSSFNSYKEKVEGLGIRCETYATRALQEINNLLPHTGVSNAETIFVIVEHPAYATALALYLADVFQKRTWTYDIGGNAHQDGAVIKITKADLAIITPPRVN